MVNECYHANKGNPILITEMGGRAMTMDDRLSHLISFYPIGMNRAIVPVLAAYGVKGMNWWQWTTNNNFINSVEPDLSLPEFTLQILRANGELRHMASLFGSIKQVNNLLLYYPRATFISAPLKYAQAYENIACALEKMGYQTRITANEDIVEALSSGMPLIIPPCVQIERSALKAIDKFVNKGGSVLFLGSMPLKDEYNRNLSKQEPELYERLFGGLSVCAPESKPEFKLLSQTILCDKSGNWKDLKGGETLLSYENKSPAAVRKRVGNGSVMLLGGDACSAFDKYRDRNKLTGKWKFNFAKTKPTHTVIETEQRDRGLAEKWFSPEYNDSSWLTMFVPGMWKDNGYLNITGIGWYRTHFSGGGKTILNSKGIHGHGTIYVNGNKVSELNAVPASIDITKYCNEGDNLLALRVVGAKNGGGFIDEIYFTRENKKVLPSLPPSAKVLSWLITNKMGAAPLSQASDYGIFSRIVMDGSGNKYLIVVNLHYAKRKFWVRVRANESSENKPAVDILSGKTVPRSSQDGFIVFTTNLEGNDYMVIPLRDIL